LGNPDFVATLIPKWYLRDWSYSDMTLTRKLVLFLFILSASQIVLAQEPILGYSSFFGNGDGSLYLVEPVAVRVVDGHAFVLTSSSLQVYDVTNADSLKHVASLITSRELPIFENASSVELYDHYLLITSRSNSKLVVIDISDHSSPVVSAIVSDGTNNVGISRPQSIAIKGHYALVGNQGDDSIEIIDISNPEQPVHSSNITNGSRGAVIRNPLSIAVQGDFAFIASQDTSALEIIDVADPTNPNHVSTIFNGFENAKLGQPQSVVVSGDYAYVVGYGIEAGSSALEIIDISSPASPHHKSSLSFGVDGSPTSFLKNVLVVGNLAFISCGLGDAIEIVDVANPSSPANVASINTETSTGLLATASSVMVSGTIAYITGRAADARDIFVAVDVSNPSTPVFRGKSKNGDGGFLMAGPRSISISGNYAYVACSESNSLSIVDLSIPNQPRAGGIIVDGDGGARLDRATSVVVSDTLAFVVSAGSKALEIIDVSNPKKPVHVSALVNGDGGAILETPYALAVSGTNAFVSNIESNVIEIIDVSDPHHPTHKGSIGTGPIPYSLAARGDYLYVLISTSLIVVDVSNPTAPSIVSSIQNVSYGGVSLFIDGNFAYISSTFTNSIEIVDISDPHLMKHTGTAGGGGHPNAITVSGDYAFVCAIGDNALAVVDVTDRSSPQFLTSIKHNISGTSIAVSGGYCYITGPAMGGIAVIDLKAARPPVLLPPVDSASTHVTAAWQKQSDVVSYAVDLLYDYQTFDYDYYDVRTGDTTLTFSNLDSMKHYYYQARAFNGRSWSQTSELKHTFTFIPAKAFSAIEVTDSSFVARWKKAPAPQSVAQLYWLELGADPNFDSMISRVFDDQHNEAVAAGLKPSTNYFYRFRDVGYYMNGETVWSPYSNTVKVFTLEKQVVTAVDESTESAGTMVYPIPANSEITVDLRAFKERRDVDISIVDMMGHRLLHMQGVNHESINISIAGFPKGTYVLLAQQKNQLYKTRFIKN
jgi:hypothetical protein